MAAGVERVHEGGQEGKFVVDSVGEKICVDEDLVGGLEGGVVGEEEGGGHLRAVVEAVVLVEMCPVVRCGTFVRRRTSLVLARRLFLSASWLSGRVRSSECSF